MNNEKKKREKKKKQNKTNKSYHPHQSHWANVQYAKLPVQPCGHVCGSPLSDRNQSKLPSMHVLSTNCQHDLSYHSQNSDKLKKINK